MNQKHDAVTTAMDTPGLRLLVESAARAGDAEAQNEVLIGHLAALWQVLTPAQRLVFLNRPSTYTSLEDSVVDYDDKLLRDGHALVEAGKGLTHEPPLLDRLIYEFPALAMDAEAPGAEVVSFVSQEVARMFPEPQL
ncbi:hypothetical protein [Paraburkholderia youngii]|uniref:hypothetical protein n=1 Tax=Paraburkholderia youngii TaxID=2782701 RepID=UPI003D1EB2EC